MKEFSLTLLLLFFELCTLHGHVISKREAIDVDRYSVKANADTIEIINSKAAKPTLREIIFYHVIEKPYPDSKQTTINNDDDKIMNKDNNDNDLILKDDQKEPVSDFPRPWTNGHGFQYLEGNNLNDQNEADIAQSSDSQRPVKNDVATSTDDKNDEQPHDEAQKSVPHVISVPLINLGPEYFPDGQENNNDLPEEIKNDNDLAEEVKKDNDLAKDDDFSTMEPKTNQNPKKDKDSTVKIGRNVHVDGPPVQSKTTGSDEIADGGDLLVDEEPPKKNPINKNAHPELRKIEDDKSISFRDFILEDQKPEGARRKRDIDYSKMHAAPPLPLFKIDQFPDYIKDILPSDDELDIPTRTEHSAYQTKTTEKHAYISRTTENSAYLSRTTEKPAYLSRTTEKPAYLSRTTEKPVYLTGSPDVAKKPVYVSRTTEKPENVMPKISVRFGDSEEQKIYKKLERPIDENIEKELSDTIQKIAEAQDTNTKLETPSSGMNLIGNSGMVWNDFNGQHYKYNVGPDATDTEDHIAQIPVKPTEKPEDTKDKDSSSVDLSSEIESAINEIGHIFEEIINNTDQEDTESDKGTTENYDIHVNINKEPNKHENVKENNEKPDNFEREGSKLDQNKEIKNDDNKEQSINGKAKSLTAENYDDEINDALMNIINAMQDLVDFSKKNESDNHENETKDKVIEPNKDSNKDNSESEANDEKEDNYGEEDTVKEILNNDNYWQWLKDTSESNMNVILKRVLGLIKEEVSKQIQHLVFKMMEEQGITPPNEDNNQQQYKDDSEGNGEGDSKLTSDEKYWNWLKNSSKEYFNILLKRVLKNIKKGVTEQIDILSTRMFKEKGYTPPKKDKNNNDDDDEHDNEDSKVLQTLKSNDNKWKWLTESSEAYLDKIMKRVNQLIEEEVTRQVTHLVKYHMPSKNGEQTSTDENPDKNEENITKNKEKDTNLDGNDDNGSKPDENISRKHKHDHKHEDEHKHDHNHEDGNKAKHIEISATNTYGTTINSDKVTNIFIFGLNSTDLKNLKPISGGNGVFIFGNNDNEQNKDSDIQSSGSTGDTNTDSKPNEDKVEIPTATPINDEDAIESTDSESNKENKDKDSSNEKETEHSGKPEKNLENLEENTAKSEENPEANSEKPLENTEKLEESSEKPEEISESPEEISEKPEDISESPEEISEKPEEISESPEENSEKPEEISESPEEISEKPEKSEENSTKSTEDSEKSEKDSENTDIDSKDSENTDIDSLDSENTYIDSKDTQNTDKDFKDEGIVKIDERLGEIGVDKEKDSNENLKDKDTKETTTESSTEKSSK